MCSRSAPPCCTIDLDGNATGAAPCTSTTCSSLALPRARVASTAYPAESGEGGEIVPTAPTPLHTTSTTHREPPA